MGERPHGRPARRTAQRGLRRSASGKKNARPDQIAVQPGASSAMVASYLDWPPSFCAANELASAFEPLRAVHTGSVVDLPSTAALTPQTLAATPTGTATVTGTWTPL